MQNNLMSSQSLNRRYATGTFNSATSGSSSDSRGSRHLQDSNYICADGHVKWLRATAISPDVWAPNFIAPAVVGAGCDNAAVLVTPITQNVTGTNNRIRVTSK